ncbi:hypothetical protein PINS_up021957 [Pythium insidiosum]|nr:hypothetical protein PINS_up021957 [Pythium insidiosum]
MKEKLTRVFLVHVVLVLLLSLSLSLAGDDASILSLDLAPSPLVLVVDELSLRLTDDESNAAYVSFLERNAGIVRNCLGLWGVRFVLFTFCIPEKAENAHKGHKKQEKGTKTKKKLG